MAVVTGANFEAEMIDREGMLLLLVGKNATTMDGTNPDMTGAKRVALASLGIAPVNAFAIEDSDFATISAGQLDQLFDVGQLRLLKNVVAWLVRVNQQVDRDKQDWSDLRDSTAARVKDLEKFCLIAYGYGGATVEGGSISLGFQEVGRPPFWDYSVDPNCWE